MKTRKYTVSLYPMLLQFQSESSIRQICDKSTFYKFAGFFFIIIPVMSKPSSTSAFIEFFLQTSEQTACAHFSIYIK